MVEDNLARGLDLRIVGLLFRRAPCALYTLVMVQGWRCAAWMWTGNITQGKVVKGMMDGMVGVSFYYGGIILGIIAFGAIVGLPATCVRP